MKHGHVGANYAAERYVPVPGLGQPGYAAERYIPTQMGSAPYAMERYIPTSLGQPGYAAERYVPVPGLGQAKGTPAGSAAFAAATSSGGKGGGTAASSGGKGGGTASGQDGGKGGGTAASSGGKGGGTASGQDNTARDWRTAGEVGGALIGGIIRATGPQTPAPADQSMLPADASALPPAQGEMDWYWPVIVGGGLILVGGIAYFALKDKKSAPTPNKRKRVSRNAYGRSRYGSASADPRWMAAKYAGVDSEGKSFKKGDEILYWPSTKTVMTGAKAKAAWLEFLSAKGDEEGMPFARNGRKRVSRNRKPAAADPIAARELLLVTENEYSLYRLHQDIEKNLLRKLKSGKYDHAKAAKAWQYWMDAGAKLYVKQYGGSFSPATRALAASEYADQWYESYKAGDVKANRRKRSSRR